LNDPLADRLVVVVGFDGSDSSIRALEAASNLVAGRVASIEIVFVAHQNSVALLSPYGAATIRNILDEEEVEMREMVRTILGDEQRWHFNRSDGDIADQLMAIAERSSEDYGPSAMVVVVVGRAGHAYHHVVGSVPVALVRHERFPVLVIP
jgi:nucleotide-binding universal stress UspA family protein